MSSWTFSWSYWHSDLDIEFNDILKYLLFALNNLFVFDVLSMLGGLQLGHSHIYVMSRFGSWIFVSSVEVSLIRGRERKRGMIRVLFDKY